MRKVVMMLSAAAAIAVATPASAQNQYANPAWPWVAGAAAGTAAGLALSQGWWTGSTVGKAIGASAVGSAAAGFVIGVGTIAMIDAATQPCKGFRALFSPFYAAPSGCVNGKYVGYAAAAKVKAKKRRV